MRSDTRTNNSEPCHVCMYVFVKMDSLSIYVYRRRSLSLSLSFLSDTRTNNSEPCHVCMFVFVGINSLYIHIYRHIYIDTSLSRSLSLCLPPSDSRTDKSELCCMRMYCACTYVCTCVCICVLSVCVCLRAYMYGCMNTLICGGVNVLICLYVCECEHMNLGSLTKPCRQERKPSRLPFGTCVHVRVRECVCVSTCQCMNIICVYTHIQMCVCVYEIHTCVYYAPSTTCIHVYVDASTYIYVDTSTYI